MAGGNGIQSSCEAEDLAHPALDALPLALIREDPEIAPLDGCGREPRSLFRLDAGIVYSDSSQHLAVGLFRSARVTHLPLTRRNIGPGPSGHQH